MLHLFSVCLGLDDGPQKGCRQVFRDTDSHLFAAFLKVIHMERPMEHRHLVKGKKLPAHLDRRPALVALVGQFFIITEIIIRPHRRKLTFPYLRWKTIL